MLNARKTILSIFAFCAISVNTAKANTIEVQNNTDSSVGSLRQAVIDANDGDTIRFNSSLIASGSNTINLTSEIAFSKNLVFKGLYNSTDTLYISGNNTNRIFNITNTVKTVIDSMVFINGYTNTSNGGALSFSLSDTVSVLNSKISNSTAQNNGGGIFYSSSSTSSGFLKIRNCIINNNSTLTYAGGGISYSSSNDNNSLIIEKSTLKNNSAVHSGGAISAGTYNTIGSLSIDSSEIYNNTTQGSGAGISIASNQSSFYSTINNSTINDNTASTIGGGIYANAKETSSIVINNTTVNNNTANIAGGISSGQIAYANTQSFVEIINSTVSNNYATDNIGGIRSMAAASANFTATNSTVYNNSVATTFNKTEGVYLMGLNSLSVECTSSIIWSPGLSGGGINIKRLTTDASSSLVDSPDPITSGGYNVFSDAPNGATATGDLTSVTETQLNLQPLANNGGYNLTMKPGVGSVAINAGNPNDFSDAQNGPIAGVRDIGAAESGSINTSVNENNLSSQISIYPNPVKNLLFIELDNQKVTEITIIDYSGRVVKTITNNTTKSIDVSDLIKGIYILKIATKNGVLTNRFIKQ